MRHQIAEYSYRLYKKIHGLHGKHPYLGPISTGLTAITAAWGRREFLYNEIQALWDNRQDYLDPEHVKKGLFQWESDFYNKFLPQQGNVALIGCGTGRDLFTLMTAQRNIVGLDISASAVKMCHELARGRGQKISVHQGNAIHYIFIEKPFDAMIISYNTYCLILSKKERIQCLKNLSSQLRAGAKIILTFAGFNPIRKVKRFYSLYNFLRKFNSQSPALTPGEYFGPGIMVYAYLPEDEILNEFKSANLRPVYFHYDLQGLAVLEVDSQ